MWSQKPTAPHVLGENHYVDVGIVPLDIVFSPLYEHTNALSTVLGFYVELLEPVTTLSSETRIKPIASPLLVSARNTL